MTSGTAKRTTNPLIGLLMQHRSPGAIAGGVAFGTVLGLVPKDSLLAVCLLALIAILPVNQLVACFATIGLTLCESLTWGLTDWIGFHTLSVGLVSSIIGTIYQMPVVPWLRLENSVVMGSLVLGMLLWGPCFLATYRISSRFQKALQTDEVVALAAAALRHQTVSQNDHFLAASSDPATEPKIKSGVMEIEQGDDGDTPSLMLQTHSDDAPRECDIEEQILHETIIEVIRFKRPAPQQDHNEPVDPVSSSSENKSMHLTNFIRKDSANVSPQKTLLPGQTLSMPPAVSVTQLHNPPHSKEESLRHILKHIHTARESKREVERSS